MPNINYIEILKKAWDITWHNRYLWWFGLLMALASPGMNYGFDTNGNEKLNSAADQKFSEFMSAHLQLIIAGALVFLAIIIILVVLGIIARAGLIKSINFVCKNQPAGFKSGMREGKKYFWKLFLLGLAIFFLVFTSIIILALPVIFLVASKAIALAIFLGILAFFIFIPVIVLVSFLKVYGNIYIVLGELSVWNALEKAYELFSKNIISSIIMGLMFIPLGFFLMMAVIAVLIPLLIIFLAVGFGLYFAAGTAGAVIAACVGIICFLIIVLSLRSVYEVFAQAVWYLFFNEIAKPKVEEKVAEEVLEKKEEVLPAVDPIKTAGVEK
jgi:hypothetical protein